MYEILYQLKNSHFKFYYIKQISIIALTINFPSKGGGSPSQSIFIKYIYRIMLCFDLNYSQRELPVLNVCFGISILLILSELHTYMVMCDMNYFVVIIISVRCLNLA